MRVGLLTAVATAIAIGAIAITGGGGGGSTTATIFFGQSSAGTGDGSSCANEKAVSFFNTLANWGAGKPIAPGVTVGLCGTVTTSIHFMASGTSGNPITLQFQSGAKISEPVCNSCIDMSDQSFIVVDGGTNGQILSNANGTNKANHLASIGIFASPCTSCEVKNLELGPFYEIVAGDQFLCTQTGGTCVVDNNAVNCMWLTGDNWRIHDNTMHDASTCLYEQTFQVGRPDSNTRIYNNNVYNFDHGWTITGSSGTWGNLFFYGNHFHDEGLWDACAANGNNCHHNAIHCFMGNGGHIPAAYVYNNVFDGTVGSSATSWIYLESNTGSACSDSTSKWYVFNNSFSSTDQVPTGPYLQSPGDASFPSPLWVYNNTFSGPGSGHYGANVSACVQATRDLENNAIGGCAQFVSTGTGTTDYNAYANLGTATSCWPSVSCVFANWQATGKDTHGVYSPGGAVGSNVTGVGTNLTSVCNSDANLAPLCSTRLGVARPTVGAWNAGDG